MTRVEEVMASFWEAGEHGVQPPLTGEMVAEAERTLGVALPRLLLDLLWVRNGGNVADAWDAFPTERATSWSEDHVPFTHVMGIGRDERFLSLLDSPYLLKEWGLPEPVVLLSGDGHYWIGLDYRASGRGGEPSVTWFDAELGEELALAEDFHAFLTGLGPYGSGPGPVE
ncbi:SMI1/KNR4 family protein [Actinomadura kijaniata]|uniref:SMI1/KNR4 family protein n=1 Tax=Actinomadura kijaniata TaxID=46161 RepID=UPI003F19B1B6